MKKLAESRKSRVESHIGVASRLLGGLLVWWFTATVHAATFSATLDRNVIRVGEQAVLTLRFDGGQPSGVPRLPDVPNLQIQFAGQSQQIALNNGQRTVSLLLNYVVAASQPGDFTIPAFNVPVAGAMPSVVRVLLHFHTERGLGEVVHVYLDGAEKLRDDLDAAT